MAVSLVVEPSLGRFGSSKGDTDLALTRLKNEAVTGFLLNHRRQHCGQRGDRLIFTLEVPDLAAFHTADHNLSRLARVERAGAVADHVVAHRLEIVGGLKKLSFRRTGERRHRRR
jgi:hypothetical protein